MYWCRERKLINVQCMGIQTGSVTPHTYTHTHKPIYTLSDCVHLQCCKEVDSGVLIQGEVGPSEVHVHYGKEVLQREKRPMHEWVVHM